MCPVYSFTEIEIREMHTGTNQGFCTCRSSERPAQPFWDWCTSSLAHWFPWLILCQTVRYQKGWASEQQYLIATTHEGLHTVVIGADSETCKCSLQRQGREPLWNNRTSEHPFCMDNHNGRGPCYFLVKNLCRIPDQIKLGSVFGYQNCWDKYSSLRKYLIKPKPNLEQPCW